MTEIPRELVDNAVKLLNEYMNYLKRAQKKLPRQRINN